MAAKALLRLLLLWPRDQVHSVKCLTGKVAVGTLPKHFESCDPQTQLQYCASDTWNQTRGIIWYTCVYRSSGIQDFCIKNGCRRTLDDPMLECPKVPHKFFLFCVCNTDCCDAELGREQKGSRCPEPSTRTKPTTTEGKSTKRPVIKNCASRKQEGDAWPIIVTAAAAVYVVVVYWALQ